jgi:tRNA1Val (adenine37-N6)-methyltransferase
VAEVGSSSPFDSLLRGRLPLAQPKHGYRTNVDALWLSAFARRERPARHVLDLGAGVGAVGLSLLVVQGALAATLLDIDDEALSLAGRNAEAAGLTARTHLVHADVGSLPANPGSLKSAFDLVVANPPYGVREAARVSPHPARARARTGDEGTLLAFARAARLALGKGGRACFVYPASDLARLLDVLRSVGLEPKRARMVHPFADAPARVALVEGKPGRPGGLRVESPLVAMSAPGQWTDEARAIVDGS